MSKGKPGRNDPCPCQSGLKFKHCHGSEKLRAICQKAAHDAANQMMVMLIQQVQAQKNICPQCKQKFENRHCSRCNVDFFTKEEAEQRQAEEAAQNKSGLVLPKQQLILPQNMKGE